MRWLSLLVLVSLTAGADDRRGRFERFCGRSAQGRSSRGLLCDDYAFFEAFPASGAGTFGPCSTTAPTGAKGEVISGTRSTVAWCTDDNYTLVQLSANQPRVMRGRPGAPLGLLSEADATNSILHNRDGSQAAWTKTNMTCTKTATGADGATNSATRCCAAAANGTVIQSIIRASSDNATSAYVLRSAGSSRVDITRDNGTTWNEITSSLTAQWKRAACRPVEGCMGGRCIVVPDMCATSANPAVGFRIANSGDCIDIDLVQNEPTLDITSPITTAGTATPRGYDFFYADLPRPMTALRSMSVTQLNTYAVNNNYALTVSNGGGAPFATIYASTPINAQSLNIGCQNTVSGGATSGNYLAAGGPTSYSCSWNTGHRRGVSNGFVGDSALATTELTGSTRVYLGGVYLGGSSQLNGLVSQVCVAENYMECEATPVTPPTSAIAWLGDSITHGAVSSPTFPHSELWRLYGQANSKLVQDVAVPGYGVDEVATLWSRAKSEGYGTLVVLVGVNNLRAGTPASYIWPRLQAILDEALSMGMNVVPITVTPWGNWAEWTAGKQAETLSLNASILSWCTTHGKTCVDAYTAFSAGGGTPEDMAAIYDSGDGLHPNAAGSTLLATIVAAASP